MMTLSANPESRGCSPHRSAKPVHQMSTTCFDLHRDIKQFYKSSQARGRGRYCEHSAPSSSHFTFRPEINEMPFEMYGAGSQGRVNRSKQEIRQSLIKDATEKVRARLSLRVDKQEEQLKQCSFVPLVSSALDAEGTETAVHERLFQEAKTLEQQRAQAQRQKQAKQIEELERIMGQKLKLGNSRLKYLNTQKRNLDPIETRIQEIVEAKMKGRKQLEAQLLRQNKISFTPAIDQTSQKIVKTKKQKQQLKVNVVQRLLSEYEKTKAKKLQAQQSQRQKQALQCTFKPEVNPGARTYNKHWLLQSLSRSMKDSQDSFKYTFHPQINSLSALIVGQTRGDETFQTKTYRLSYQPMEDKKQSALKTEKEMYGRYNFTPHINPLSMQMAATHRHHQCPTAPEEVFSFKPVINEKSRLMRTESLELNKFKQKKKQLQHKLESEYLEYAECTFRPRINNKRHNQQRSIYEVEGAQKYIQFQQKSRENAKKIKKRQQQLFKPEIKYDLRRHKSARQNISASAEYA